MIDSIIFESRNCVCVCVYFREKENFTYIHGVNAQKKTTTTTKAGNILNTAEITTMHCRMNRFGFVLYVGLGSF